MMQFKSTALTKIMRYRIAVLACGLVGLLASFVLTYEKLHLLQNPTEAPSCSINPIITCSSAMSSSQSQLFGIPISLFGIIAYVALITVAALLLTNTILHKTIWKMMLAAAAIGVTVMHYLLLQSVFVLHVICPWCFGIWITTPIILVALLVLYVREFKEAPALVRVPAAHPGRVLGIWYAALFLLLVTVFWDAWELLLGL